MSINLTNIEQYSIGANVVESNPQAAAISPQIDFNSSTIAWSIQSGQLTNGVFAAGGRSRSITVQINAMNGTWTAEGLSGTISPAIQTQLHTMLTNLRNAMENFSVNNGIIAGTQVPWS
jgi:hypothetical protein